MASLLWKRCLAMNRRFSSQPVALATRGIASSWNACSPALSSRSASQQSSKVLFAAGILGTAVAAAATPTSAPAQCQSASTTGSCETITLKDGRRFAYKMHGTGVPVFAFHGMESSRETFDTNIWGSPPQPLESLYPGVQVIAIDRPGYGDSSDPPQGYSYLKFVDDLVELADKLGLQKFCVAGHSSGGPYALAASALLPNRVVACAAISSDAPYVHPRASPELVKAGADMGGDPLIRSGYYGGSKSDNLVWKQGCLGWVCDYVLERIEYPFSVEGISLGKRLTIWVGTQDVPAISLSAKFLQELLPGSQFREQPRGHGLKKDLNGTKEFGFLGDGKQIQSDGESA